MPEFNQFRLKNRLKIGNRVVTQAEPNPFFGIIPADMNMEKSSCTE